MSDRDRRIADLLDRAAAGEIAAAPLDELVRRGRARRRSHVWLAAAATIVVIGVFVGAGFAIQHGDDERPVPVGPAPTSAPSVDEQLPDGPTAQDIADGHWTRTSPAPTPLCWDAQTAWAADRLYVVSSSASACAGETDEAVPVVVAAYDARHDSWEELPAPDDVGAGFTVSTNGDELVVADASGTAAALPVGVAEPAWRSLPAVPEPAPDNSHIALGVMVNGGFVAAGTGPAGDGVWLLHDNGWEALPRIPHAWSETVSPGPSKEEWLDEQVDGSSTPHLVQVHLATAGGRLHAFTIVRQDFGSGFRAKGQAYVFDGNGWIRLDSKEFPLSVTHTDPLGSDLLITGSTCPPFGRCPAMQRQPILVYHWPDQSVVSLSDCPLSIAHPEVAAAGAAIIAYNADSTANFDGEHIEPGDTAVYDPDEQRWLLAPSSPTVREVAVTGWTPYGFVVVSQLDEPGAILKPAAVR
jgi:hypothetical protein